jgi:hypothetical protein
MIMLKPNFKTQRLAAIQAVSGALREKKLDPAAFDGKFAAATLHQLCRQEPDLMIAQFERRASPAQRKLFERDWNQYHQRSRRRAY